MGHYCFAGWRLSSSVICHRCNVAGVRDGRSLGACRAADTVRRASTVTSRYGDHVNVIYNSDHTEKRLTESEIAGVDNAEVESVRMDLSELSCAAISSN